jgi:hypothetical protein
MAAETRAFDVSEQETEIRDTPSIFDPIREWISSIGEANDASTTDAAIQAEAKNANTALTIGEEYARKFSGDQNITETQVAQEASKAFNSDGSLVDPNLQSGGFTSTMQELSREVGKRWLQRLGLEERATTNEIKIALEDPSKQENLRKKEGNNVVKVVIALLQIGGTIGSVFALYYLIMKALTADVGGHCYCNGLKDNKTVANISGCSKDDCNGDESGPACCANCCKSNGYDAGRCACAYQECNIFCLIGQMGGTLLNKAEDLGSDALNWFGGAAGHIITIVLYVLMGLLVLYVFVRWILPLLKDNFNKS